jgi:dTDP-4-amino-4,6-dideoxygalactose transaminase
MGEMRKMIQLIDLKAQYLSMKPEIDSAIQRVLDNGSFILGQEVSTFESHVAEYCGVKYAIGVGSGTDALYLALVAYNIGVGDEVITTPFTFIATAEAISRCGAVPVFVDIDLNTFNIDATKIKEKITKRTKAILPVHMYGQPCGMYDILDIAKKHHLLVIEDCAQAMGAVYQGSKVGSIGDAGCLSFFPGKVLGGYGDGGMVLTNNDLINDRIRSLRAHGAKNKYYHLELGINSRLDSLQAAILDVKLAHLDYWIHERRGNEVLYRIMLDAIPQIKRPRPLERHAFGYYVIRTKNRAEMQEYLKSQGIDTAIHYPISLHLQEAYKELGYKKGDFPNSEVAQEEVLSLPMYAELTNRQIKHICGSIKEFCVKS